MDFFQDFQAIVDWLENKAILSCHGDQHKRYMQIEWQLAQKLRLIEALLKNKDWEALEKFVNSGIR